MSKYKLINKTTGTETICDKVTIDGFDYYVSDEKPKRKSICISKTNAVYQNNQQSLNDKLVFLDKEVVNIHEIIGRVEFGEDSVNLPFDISELKKVIATNNPNSDIPKVVDEVEMLGEDETNIRILQHKTPSQIARQYFDGFIQGYNKSQERYSFSEEDMVEFGEMVAWNMVGKTITESFVKGISKEILQLWKEQKPKIVYYE